MREAMGLAPMVSDVSPIHSPVAATESQYMRGMVLEEIVGGSPPRSFTQLLLRLYSVPRITFPVVKVWGFCLHEV